MMLIVLLTIVKTGVTILPVVLWRLLLGVMTVMVLVVLVIIVTATSTSSAAPSSIVVPRAPFTVAILIEHLTLLLVQHFLTRSFGQYWLITAVCTVPVLMVLAVILATGRVKMPLKVARSVSTGTTMLVKRGLLR